MFLVFIYYTLCYFLAGQDTDTHNAFPNKKIRDYLIDSFP